MNSKLLHYNLLHFHSRKMMNIKKNRKFSLINKWDNMWTKSPHMERFHYSLHYMKIIFYPKWNLSTWNELLTFMIHTDISSTMWTQIRNFKTTFIPSNNPCWQWFSFICEMLSYIHFLLFSFCGLFYNTATT